MLSRIISRLFSITRKYEDVYDRRFSPVQFDSRWTRFQYKKNQIPINAQPICLQQLDFHKIPDTDNFTNIPTLQHGLQGCLDCKIYDGDKGVGQFPKNITKEFLDTINDYKKPSEDQQLLKLAEQKNCKYISSTSNISSLLIHANYIFTSFRRPNFTKILQNTDEPKIHMISYRKPHTFILKKIKNKDQYVIESDPGLYMPENQILMKTGSLVQYLLTTSKQQIKKQIISKKAERKPQYYRYRVINHNMLLRSQIDCRQTDSNIVFQIKTRATAPIRYDVQNYTSYLDYQLKYRKGIFESYERENYDLIRGGFIKYAYQLIIGGMDGALVAFHNTNKIYGYQYVPLTEITRRLFGDQFNMNLNFMVCSKMITQVLNEITNNFKDNEDFKIGLYANSVKKSLIVFVELLEVQKQYQKIRKKNDNDGVQSYFKEFKGLQNPVYKFQFDFFIFNNEILIRNPEVYFQPTDNISLSWKHKRIGRALSFDYMSFLYDAYKLQNIFGSPRYNGAWSRKDEVEGR